MASTQLFTIGWFTGSRAGRGALSPAAAIRRAAALMASVVDGAVLVTLAPVVNAAPGAGRGRSSR
ncbi:hypothetical protein GTS_06160 [Gandjariella thermophila]|uniref:Uncharacterized protein n=1 Tax=Gandjariella thermophila TaxID=1931992 RepID=A0A4D4J4U8_9PSEU|nr:hypothetical protein GTS_06160 [Gandjariella thermophila]